MKNKNWRPEKTYLINMDRRVDRLNEFNETLPDPWPFPEVERYRAVDGSKVPTPPQWKNGNGAWGCYRSHLNILEDCLMNGVSSYVVFEDDAGFCDDFTERVQEYIEHLPEDWGLAYLGGQNLKTAKSPPQPINDFVFRPYNVNRTHAFMVRGNEMMRKLYRHLTWNGWIQKSHHIDHHLGRLVQRSYVAEVRGQDVQKERVPTYIPATWLCSQKAGKSNICGLRFDEDRFFNSAEQIMETLGKTFATVLGPHRSGTSCVAMILHHLGVHMGNQLGGYEKTGGGEAVGLSSICEKAMKFPSTDVEWQRPQLVQSLQTFVNSKRQEAVIRQTIAGGKYPHLCLMADELREAIGEGMMVIAVDRPLEDSIDSLDRRSQKNDGAWHSCTPEQSTNLQTALWNAREKFLEDNPQIPRLRVDYYELLKDPAKWITNIAEFLGLNCSETQIAAAVGHVDPSLNGAKKDA